MEKTSYRDKIIELGYNCYLNGGNSIIDNPFPTDAPGFELFLYGFNLAKKHDTNLKSKPTTI